MDKKKFSDHLKDGISVRDIEEFARKHTTEVFGILAIVIGSISSAFDFFTGPGLSLFLLMVGSILSLVFPAQVERNLKQLFNFLSKQDKTTEMIIGCVEIVIAIFVPFLIFGLLGLLAGTSFHFYIRHAQIVSENKPHKSAKISTGDEHD